MVCMNVAHVKSMHASLLIVAQKAEKSAFAWG